MMEMVTLSYHQHAEVGFRAAVSIYEVNIFPWEVLGYVNAFQNHE